MSVGTPKIKYYLENIINFVFKKRYPIDSLMAIINDGEKGGKIVGKKQRNYRFTKKKGGTLTMEKIQKLYKEIS